MIDSYDPGQVVVDGEAYIADVIISPSAFKAWWRKEGHEISIKDLDVLISDKPEVLVIGTGIFGKVKMPPGVRKRIETLRISLVAETTDKACKTYNQSCYLKKVVAALHLTC